jgi:hypothetical protein
VEYKLQVFHSGRPQGPQHHSVPLPCSEPEPKKRSVWMELSMNMKRMGINSNELLGLVWMWSIPTTKYRHTFRVRHTLIKAEKSMHTCIDYICRGETNGTCGKWMQMVITCEYHWILGCVSYDIITSTNFDILWAIRGRKAHLQTIWAWINVVYTQNGKGCGHRCRLPIDGKISVFGDRIPPPLSIWSKSM